MSAADERPESALSLAAAADLLSEAHPGFRVEIIGGQILVSPPADGLHARALTRLMAPFLTAGPIGEGFEVLQAVGLWLPTGAEDYAIPDLAIVDADFYEHRVGKNCYDPVVFRLVLEVTSSNYRTDLRTKVAAYADAQVPVYVIVDRKHDRLHVLTEPEGSDYASHEIHPRGQLVALPDSIGAKVTLDVTALLDAATLGE
ncbi:Uma2 family endonuclease [Streptomyces smaragdinus]|nr:Uma2 family endonuclease [Streptomyces smaragdinus]